MKAIIDFKELTEQQRFRIHLLKKDIQSNYKGAVRENMLQLLSRIFSF